MRTKFAVYGAWLFGIFAFLAHKDGTLAGKLNEFINLGNFTPDTLRFNRNLTEWLIEYNFYRPRQSLNYGTLINFNNSIKVLPMYSLNTVS